MPTNVRKNKYTNTKIVCPDGYTFYSSKVKADWYLKRGLAREDDGVYTLLFAPKVHPVCNFPKPNHCVVCGATEYNGHHIVPKQFVSTFSEQARRQTVYDVMPLCVEHHKQYEIEAEKFKKLLRSQYGLNEVDGTAWIEFAVDFCGGPDRIAQVWRWHFIATMLPKYMPDGWRVDAEVYL